MKDQKSLNQLKPGERARVKEIKANGSMRRRLLDLGLINGTEVECLGTSACGDPSAYLIRGAVIAIRSEDSSNIIVLRGDCNGLDQQLSRP